MMIALSILAYLVIGAMFAGLIWVLYVEGVRIYRQAHQKPVTPSPLLTHGELTRRQAKRAKARAGYIDAPWGKERIGL